MTKTNGFRFSMMDAVAIVVCAGVTWALWDSEERFVLIFPIVLGHFFLFCNVFRIGNRAELVWAGAFMVNVVAWHASGMASWAAILAVQTPLTGVLIAKALCSPTYHGIGYGLINRERVDADALSKKE